MTEHTIRIASVQQTSVDPASGSVVIAQPARDGHDLYVIEFASDKFAFDLMQSIATVRVWHDDACTAGHALTVDDECGGGDYPPVVPYRTRTYDEGDPVYRSQMCDAGREALL